MLPYRPRDKKWFTWFTPRLGSGSLRSLALLVLGILAMSCAQAQVDDYGNTSATAAPLALNSTTAGVLNSTTDVDYFRLTLAQATHVAFYTTGGTDTLGSLRDGSDQEIVASDDAADQNFRIEGDLAAGTYYLRVTGYDGAIGDYSLRVETATFGIDDHGNTAATATAVVLNVTTAGRLNSFTDVDYFRFSLASPTHVVVYTTGITDPTGSLRNSSDQEIASNDDGPVDRNFRIEKDLAIGTYYVRVTGYQGATGSYALRVEGADATTVTTALPGNVTATGATLGGSVLSTPSVSQRGVVYGLTPSPTVGNLSSVSVLSGSGVGTFSVASGTLQPNTRYYVRAFAVTSTATVYGNELNFTTSATALIDDHGNTAATATAVAANASVAGVLNSTVDVDYFRFALTAAAQVVVSSSGSTDVLGSLRNASDQEIASDDNGGGAGNFRIAQTLDAGTYYVRVTGQGGVTGSYTLSVQTAPADPPSVTTATPAEITGFTATLGGQVTTAGSAAVTQRGVVYGTSSLPVINNASFVTLPAGTGVGVFTVAAGALAPRTHYFARAFAVSAVGVGYGQAVEFTTDDDDFGNSATTATTLAVNTTTNGLINRAADIDYFRFTLTADVHVTIFTTGILDTAGSLRSSADQEIEAGDGGGEGLNFRLERNLGAGTYYLRVSANQGGTGGYALRLEATTSPVLVTAVPTEVGALSVTLGGTISSDGGTAITRRGVVIGQSPGPTLATAIVLSSGAGTGTFAETWSEAVPDTIYFVRAFAVNGAGVAYGNEVQFATAPGSRLVNLSIRGELGGGQSLLVGFTLGGAGSKPVLLRGIGPTLARFGVTGALDDPFLQLSNSRTAIASNDDWDENATLVAATASVGAFPLVRGTKDAVLLQSLESGSYNVNVGGGNGTALVELYDAGQVAGPRLINVSTRTEVGSGGNILIAGFTLSGPRTKTLVIRAVGPTLAEFQVPGVLADPRLEVYQSGRADAIAANDNWGGGTELANAFARVGAFALPADSRDAALILTLPAGSYTAQVSGVNGTSGAALVEIYEMP